MPPIILASQSPRRKDLLELMGLTFSVIPSNFEEHLDHSRSVNEVATELALSKAHDVAKQHPEAIVIGADTIVVIDGTQLGKPKDETEARHTLTLLAGRKHVVATGIAVIYAQKNIEMTAAVQSKVVFKKLDPRALETYLASGDWHDKAGSYGLQSGGAPLVNYIEGEYDSILGLPTNALATLLQRIGISSRKVTLKAPVPQHKLP